MQPRTTTTEAEAEIEKYRELIDNKLAAFEATDFNGSSDRQGGLYSRNCERQKWVRRVLLHIVQFFETSISVQLLKKFLPVDWDSGWYE